MYVYNNICNCSQLQLMVTNFDTAAISISIAFIVIIMILKSKMMAHSYTFISTCRNNHLILNNQEISNEYISYTQEYYKSNIVNLLWNYMSKWSIHRTIETKWHRMMKYYCIILKNSDNFLFCSFYFYIWINTSMYIQVNLKLLTISGTQNNSK